MGVGDSFVERSIETSHTLKMVGLFKPLSKSDKIFGVLITGFLLLNLGLLAHSSAAETIGFGWALIGLVPTVFIFVASKFIQSLDPWLQQRRRLRQSLTAFAFVPFVVVISALGLGGFMNEKLDRGVERIVRNCIVREVNPTRGRARLFQGTHIHFENCQKVSIADFDTEIPVGTQVAVYEKPGFFAFPWINRVESQQ